MKKTGMMVLLAMLLVPGVLQAQAPGEPRRTALRFGGGMSYVEMGELNDIIDQIFEGIPIVEGTKSIHLSLDFRSEIAIPVGEFMTVAPALEVQVVPKVYRYISIYGYGSSSSDLTIIAYNVSSGLMLSLTPRLSDRADLELTGGPCLNLAGISADGGGLDDETGSGSGIGARGELALTFYLGERNSTALRMGVVARYAKVSIDGGWDELDFSGGGMFASIHIPL